MLALEYRGIDIDPLPCDEALAVVADALEVQELRRGDYQVALARVLSQAFGDGKKMSGGFHNRARC